MPDTTPPNTPLDPRIAGPVYAIATSPLVETLNAFLPQSTAGMLVKILIQIPGTVLDYTMNVKINQKDGKTVYEARGGAIADVIEGASIQAMLTASIAVTATALVGGITVGIPIAIAAGVGTAVYLAVDSLPGQGHVKRLLQALGEIGNHQPDSPINQARLMEIMSQEPHVQNNLALSMATQNGASYVDLRYDPSSTVEMRPLSEFVDAMREVREEMVGEWTSPLFTTPKILVSLPDGQYPAYIGTINGDLLDASSEQRSVELYGNPGPDTLRGGYGDDHHDGGRGDDDMRDEWGENRYYLQYANNGHDRIKDGERTGVLLLGGYAISGMATREGDGRYKLVRDDVDLYLTRVDASRNADPRGDSLVITFDEAFEGASNSVLIEDFRSGDFGIHLPASYLTLPLTGYRTVLGTLSNSNVLALSLQADPSAPGSGGDYYPIYLNYTIYDGDGGVVKPLSRLVEVVNTVGTMPYGQIGKQKSLTLKNGNTVVTWLQTLAVDVGDGSSKWDDTRLFALIMNRDGVIIKAPFRVSQVTAPSTYEAGRLTTSDDYDIALLTGEEPGFAVSWPDVSYHPQPYVAIRSFSENGEPFTDDKIVAMNNQNAALGFVRGVVGVTIVSVKDDVFYLEWSNAESASILNPGSRDTYTLAHATTFANGTIIPDTFGCSVGRPVVWGEQRIVYYGANNRLTACDPTSLTGMIQYTFAYNYTHSIPAPGYIVAVHPLSNRRLFVELGGYSDDVIGSNYYRTGVYELTQNNDLRPVIEPSVVPVPVPYRSYGSGYNLSCYPSRSTMLKKGNALLHVQLCNWENNVEGSPYLPTSQIINFNPIAGYDKPAEIRTVGSYGTSQQELVGDNVFNNRFYINTMESTTIVAGPKNNKIIFEAEWAADYAQRVTIQNYRPTDVINLGVFADRMVYMSQPVEGSQKGYIYVHSYTKEMYELASEADYQNAPYLTIEVEFDPSVQPVLSPATIIKAQGVAIEVSAPPFALPPRSPVASPVPVSPIPEEPIPAPEPEPVSPPSPMGGEPVSSPGFAPVPVPMPDQPQAPSPVIVAPPEPQLYTSGGTRPRPPFSEVMDIAWGLVGWVSRQATQKFLAPANTNAEPEVVAESTVVPLNITVTPLSPEQSSDTVSLLASQFITQAKANGWHVDEEAAAHAFANGEFSYDTQSRSVTFSPETKAALESSLTSSTALFGQGLAKSSALNFVSGFVDGWQFSSPEHKVMAQLAVQTGQIAITALSGASALYLAAGNLVGEGVSRFYSPTIGGLITESVKTISDALLMSGPLPLYAAKVVADVAKPLLQVGGSYAAQYLQGQAQQQDEKQSGSSR